jgi:hypothetical protein
MSATEYKSDPKGGNPLEQHVLREEAELRLLTSFIHGVRG